MFGRNKTVKTKSRLEMLRIVLEIWKYRRRICAGFFFFKYVKQVKLLRKGEV